MQDSRRNAEAAAAYHQKQMKVGIGPHTRAPARGHRAAYTRTGTHHTPPMNTLQYPRSLTRLQGGVQGEQCGA